MSAQALAELLAGGLPGFCLSGIVAFWMVSRRHQPPLLVRSDRARLACLPPSNTAASRLRD